MDHAMPAARWRTLVLLAAIVGAAASAYLLVEYVTGRPGVCLTGSGCDLVRASAFAYPLGIPTPLIGLVFYVAAIWLALRTLDPRPIGRLRPDLALAGLAGAGAVASLVLTALEAFVIRAYCSWCLVQAVASLILLLAALALLRSPEQPISGHSSRTRQQVARARERERSSLRRSGGIGGGLATLVLGVLLLAGWAGGTTPSASPGPSGLAPAGSPRLGTGAVEVVEFADFQCPGCASVAPIVAELASSNEMTLVYRYFPLDSIHANANRSARAAAAADAQGSFWEMAAALYARQDAWKDLSGPDADAYFATIAGDLGLDHAAWQASYTSADTEAVVAADRDAALALGLNSTPTLIINGTPYDGPLSVDGIRAAIAAAAT